MASKRKGGGTSDEFVEVMSLFPWKVGVIAAVAISIVFHALAAATGSRGKPAVDLISGLVWPLVLTVGKYYVPILCLVGAAVSVFAQYKRGGLVSKVTKSTAASALNDMSWQEFELLVSEFFRMQGYRVEEQGGSQPDGGVDLTLHRDGETFLVQCKQWKAFTVGVEIVRELYGVMASQGAAGGFVITSGRFTAPAQEFVSGRNVTLIDGQKLFGLIQRAKASPRSANAGVAAPRVAQTAVAAPACPVCNSAMVRRTSKKGANAGSPFWGCPKYPSCRGTRLIS